ncbi:MAG: PDZ domain-containing protein [Gammaproteobacteria bacterium]|nr:PDZ domain-containing protein [Gammaproteobacteria bacterium]
MDDGFEAVSHLEVPRAEVWRRCRLPGPTDADECRIPGFPSVDGAPGCAAQVLECEPQKLLRCRKLDMPCAGTGITVRIEPANAAGWPTRVTLRQEGFGAALPRDILEAHWRQIAADFRLYLEREITVPGTAWGVDLGALFRPTPVGLEVTAVAEGGPAERVGLREGDLLLTVGPIRVHGLAQLWTVLALLPAARELTLGWSRGREWREGSVEP